MYVLGICVSLFIWYLHLSIHLKPIKWMPLLTIFLFKFSVLSHVFFVFEFAFENVFVSV